MEFRSEALLFNRLHTESALLFLLDIRGGLYRRLYIEPYAQPQCVYRTCVDDSIHKHSFSLRATRENGRKPQTVFEIVS